MIEKRKIKLLHGDCLKLMKNIPDGSIDAVICDPPYKVISGGSNSSNSNMGVLIKTGNDGKLFKHNDIKPKDFIKEIYRVTKDMGHVYIMTNTINLETMLYESRMAGFKLHNVLIWLKNTCTPNRWYMKNIEYVLFLRKGKAKAINNKGSKTATLFNNPTSKIHPAEKPIDLMSHYIENSTNEGDTVLDPFAGIGSTGVACKKLNRRFIGIELDKDYFEIAKKRIRLTRIIKSYD